MDPRPVRPSLAIVNKTVESFPDARADALAAHLDLVLEWNPSLGLVSKKEPLAACERLLLESLELDRILSLSGPARIADVGSGAGFPGVVWAIQHATLQVTLVERGEKKAVWLERVCRTMGLANAAVIARDVRDVARDPSFGAVFDAAVTMAVGHPERIGPHLETLVRDGGCFVTTLPRAVTAPATIGGALRWMRTEEGNFGRYAIYRRGV